MRRKISVFALRNLPLALSFIGAMLFTPCLPAEAQQASRIPKVGYLSGLGDPKHPGAQVEVFRRGLSDLGYIEGKNILVEYRYHEGKVDRVPGLVAELVQLKVDVLVVVPSPAIRAAKQATKTIPIVMVTTQDPVETGLIDSLARPGGNITGLTRLTRDLNGKRLELFKEAVPTISRIGVLLDANTTTGRVHLADYDIAARPLKIVLQSLDVQRQNPDFAAAFQSAVRGRVNAVMTIGNALTLSYRNQIAELAIKNRMPSMYETKDYVESGGLMSYAADDSESFKRAATYVDKILKGAKPAEIPVEQPTKFELVINLKTAKQIGLTISPNVLARADRVIR
jgi:putative ABC transport system substrate-binding protein